MNMNNFPKLGITTADLVAEIDRLLDEARETKHDFGAVNWADIGVSDIEYRMSVLRPGEPYCAIILEEASPDCGLGVWLNERLDKQRFPRVQFECEW